MRKKHKPRIAPVVFLAVVLAALTTAAMGGALGNGFVNYDDELYVAQNPQVLSGLTSAGAWWAFAPSWEVSNWHPLTWLSLQLDASLFGIDPFGYHLANLLLHVATTILLFRVLLRMTGKVGRSAFVAALFGLHPLHVESVAWVAERKDVLSAFFWMLTLLAYSWYTDHRGLVSYLLVVVLYALGVLAKPMVVTLPGVLLLLDYWPLERIGEKAGSGPGQAISRVLLEKAPLAAVALGSSAITLLVQQESLGSLERIPLTVRMGNALVVYVRYLEKSLWPVNLAVFYPHPGGSLPPWQIAGAGGLLAAMTWVAVRYRRERPYLLVGWLWYLLTLVPVIGIVQVGWQGMADRYTYLPLIGIFVIVSWGAADLASRFHVAPPALWLAAGVLLSACAILSHWQVGYWQGGRRLWEHTLEVTANNDVAHNNLGELLAREGKDQEALYHFAKGLQINPQSADACYNLGLSFARLGRTKDAIHHFSEAIRIRPHFPRALNNLGQALNEEGRSDEAIKAYSEALRSSPHYALAHNNLAYTLTLRGRLDEAIRHFQAALEINPNLAMAHDSLGIAYCLTGATARASDCFRRALELQPGVGQYYYDLGHALSKLGQAKAARACYLEGRRRDPDWPEKANRNAWALATAAEPSRRNGPFALRLTRQVAEASGGREPEYLDTGAAALAEVGHFDEAIAMARDALAEGKKQGQRRNDARRALLALYEAHKPFHQTPAEQADGR
jgi:tetratricopeptide (TPR) repeat protein